MHTEIDFYRQYVILWELLEYESSFLEVIEYKSDLLWNLFGFQLRRVINTLHYRLGKVLKAEAGGTDNASDMHNSKVHSYLILEWLFKNTLAYEHKPHTNI